MATKQTTTTKPATDAVNGLVDACAALIIAEAVLAGPSATKVPKVPNQAITLLVTVNPKRGKSQARYELYKTCTTTHAFIAAGGYSADLAWDTQRKFISLAPLPN